MMTKLLNITIYAVIILVRYIHIHFKIKSRKSRVQYSQNSWRAQTNKVLLIIRTRQKMSRRDGMMSVMYSTAPCHNTLCISTTKSSGFHSSETIKFPSMRNDTSCTHFKIKACQQQKELHQLGRKTSYLLHVDSTNQMV